jgi:GNAT superfamily N-acetyltransferase
MLYIKNGLLALTVAASSMLLKAAQDIEFVKQTEKYRTHIEALSKGQKIGEISYWSPACYIHTLSVDDKLQRKGIGSQLFKLAINDMDDCENVKWHARLPSIDFYFKQGAHIDPDMPMYGTTFPYKNITEEEKSKYVQELYRLKKEDPTALCPGVDMIFNNKKRKQ